MKKSIGRTTRPSLPLRTVLLVLLGTLLAVTLFGRGLGLRRARAGMAAGRALGLMPGEFESQEALLLAWPRLARPTQPDGSVEKSETDRISCDIVAALRQQVRIAVPAEQPSTRARIASLLSEASLPEDSVEFLPAPANYQWVRDYGPACLRLPGGAHAFVDADYVGAGMVNVHPQEDRFPTALGKSLGVQVIRAPIALQHGNLLSNGRGLCITTRKLLRENHCRGYHEKDVVRILRTFYGARQVLFLELLVGEPTGHVDMFATFTAPDTVVVGQYAQEVDPVNAAILDRNAARLAALKLSDGPLRVMRIPMPPRPQVAGGRQLWPTYTNVVYSNRTLLVPAYPGLDPAAESGAMRLYESLCPDRKIVGIDAWPLLASGGSLHCATTNLFSMGNPGPNPAAQ